MSEWGLHTASDSYPSGDQVDVPAVMNGVRRLADFAHRTHPGAAVFLGMTPDEQFDHFNDHLAPIYEQHGLPVPGVGRWMDFTDSVKDHWRGGHTASTDGVRYAHLVEADVAEDLQKLGMPSPVKRPTNWPPEEGWQPRDEGDGMVTLYHRTSHENADEIVKGQRFLPGKKWYPRDPDKWQYPPDIDQTWFSTSPAGRSSGGYDERGYERYGPAVVKVRVPKEKVYWDSSNFDTTPGADNHAYVYPEDLDGIPITRHSALRTAMPAPLPEGIAFHHHPTENGGGMVEVVMPGAPAWKGQQGLVGYLGYEPDGEIGGVEVHPDYQRHGIATAMNDLARQHMPELYHSSDLTDDGEAWMDYEQNRFARLAMPAPAPEGLNFKHHTQDSTIPRGHNLPPEAPLVTAHIGDDPAPIGYLEWFYNDDYDYGDVDDEDLADHGEVRYIHVNPDWRSSNVASSMFDWTKKNVIPELHHSKQRTDDGNGWVRYMQTRDDDHTAARIAMPAPLPKGTYFRYHPELVWSPGVTAHAPGGKMVGSLEWYDDDHIMCDLGTRRPGEIDRIQVPEDQRGQSIATSMFDFAKQHEPRLHHSDQLTPDGEGWSQYEQSRHARIAMAWQDYADKIRGGCRACHDGWEGRYTIPQAGAFLNYVHADNGGNPEVRIQGIYTHPTDRGDGVAEALVRRLSEDHPGVPINPGYMTPDGQKFHDRMVEKEPTARDVVTARLAAVTQDLVDRLKGEFKDWHRQQPKGSIFGGGIIGGLNEWPNVEKFLKDRYPAAHRGLMMGYEQAGPLLDDRPLQADSMMPGPLEYLEPKPYETGPEAEARHGYDPKEIAAGMLLLHNKTDRFRGDMSQEDQGRLNDIAQKRYQMQRQYEQRQTTAGRNGDPPPMTYEPFNTMWTNGIMARHAADGRPIAHLHWYTDGEIETIRVHPQMQGRDIGTEIIKHAATHPETYESEGGIQPSNTLTPAGRALARSLGHTPSDEEVTPAEGEEEWPWKAVDNYVPMHIPYTGQNEAQMSKYLDQPWSPQNRTASTAGDGWPVWWRGKQRPAVPFDKRWGPNHPEHIPAPWES